jgi:hypothetical protein
MRGVAALVGVAVAPAIALALVSQPDRARVFALGLVLAGGAASQHGTRTGVLTALGCTVATAAGYALAGDATAIAVLVGTLALLGALQARRGLHYPALQPAIAVAATAMSHGITTHQASVLTLLFGVGALFAVALVDLCGARVTVGLPQSARWAETVYFAAGAAVLGGVATYLAIDHATIGGAWLTVMLLVVAPPTFAAILDREVAPMFVALVGSVAALAVVGLMMPELMPVVGLVGSVAVALVTRPTYWRFAALVGSGAILLVAAAPVGDAVVSTRTALASIAVAAVTAASAGLCLLADRGTGRGHVSSRPSSRRRSRIRKARVPTNGMNHKS